MKPLPILLLALAWFTGRAGDLVYHDALTAVADTTVMLTLPDSISRYDIEARGHTVNPSDTWGLIFRRHGAGNTVLRATITTGMTDNAFNDPSNARVEVTDSTGNVIYSSLFNKGFGVARCEDNTLLAEVGPQNISIYGGSGYLTFITELPVNNPLALEPGIIADGELKLSTVATETCRDLALLLSTGLTPDSIAILTAAASSDSPTGIWNYLDGENDDLIARNGGRYRLAIIPDGEKGYSVIYLGGAEVKRDSWKPGMIKARLRPTRFTDHYDTVWYDAEMQPIDRDVSATIEQKAILTVYLPALGAKLRFARE